ncbi:MAG: FixH family protein [Chlorobi bacterium]|nr:FixH family protein [Chlorobiota bacterium]MCI0715163.1 FixH family protein [Chlorobiota bacterium]
MKFSWGKGIILAYLLFMSGVFIMVSISMTKDIELVTQNYYDKEIKYQKQIDKINNTNRLKEQVKIDAGEAGILISFPKVKGQIKGEISFYRPSDSKKDFSVPVELTSNLTQSLTTESMQKGLWKIQISWNANGIDYYNEERIIVN